VASESFVASSSTTATIGGAGSAQTAAILPNDAVAFLLNSGHEMQVWSSAGVKTADVSVSATSLGAADGLIGLADGRIGLYSGNQTAAGFVVYNQNGSVYTAYTQFTGFSYETSGAQLSNGNLAFAWESNVSRQHTYAAVLTEAGTSVISAFDVVTTDSVPHGSSPAYQYYNVSIAANNSGQFLIAISGYYDDYYGVQLF
jgi:hypothetical protein